MDGWERELMKGDEVADGEVGGREKEKERKKERRRRFKKIIIL